MQLQLVLLVKAPQTMMVVNLIATMTLISLVRGSPMSYVTYRRRELPVDGRPELLLLYDQKGLENTDPPLRSSNEIERDYGIELSLQNDIPDVGNDPGASIARTKKLGLSRNSLSIVNPVDVLRQRVMLELARRKAMQDQRQVDANRRILETIGKRSIGDENSGYPRTVGPFHSVNSQMYTNELRNKNLQHSQEQHHAYTQRIPIDRTREWYNIDDSVIGENDDEDTRKVLSNYHNDRM